MLCKLSLPLLSLRTVNTVDAQSAYIGSDIPRIGGLGHSPTLSTEVKESVYLNLYSPSRQTWPLLV